ncbi:hypothetical protein [Clostridium akagii]|uniref:hypothetical protein n=1 Tax=Clostridium akagii TaxID=91623 RepID=UPI000478BD0A|nr:hypothetical protein [Clostridium akagii]
MLKLKTIGSRIVDSVFHSKTHLIENFNCSTDKQNQLLMFIKPEVFFMNCERKTAKVVNTIIEILDSYEADIAGVYNFSGKGIRETKMLDRHFGLINIMSRKSSKLLNFREKSDIRKTLGADESIPIRGGHEYLGENESMSTSELNGVWMSREIVKIRNGLYVQKNKIKSQDIILVNGFHPAQLNHFTKAGRHTIVLLINSNFPWRIMRKYMLGNTFPEKAESGSMRNIMYNNANEFGLEKVNVANNCIHLSAGPFEAMSEIFNFLQYIKGTEFSLSKLNIAEALKRSGMHDNDCEEAIKNPEILIDGQKMRLFDVTERLDTYESIDLFKKGRQ